MEAPRSGPEAFGPMPQPGAKEDFNSTMKGIFEDRERALRKFQEMGYTGMLFSTQDSNVSNFEGSYLYGTLNDHLIQVRKYSDGRIFAEISGDDLPDGHVFLTPEQSEQLYGKFKDVALPRDEEMRHTASKEEEQRQTADVISKFV